MDIRVAADPTTAAAEAAAWLTRRLGDAIARRGGASLAVSGGSTAPALLAELAGSDLPWERLEVWQVDERVAPDGHAARNANQLATLPAAVRRHPMPVAADDLERAAAEYAAGLPERFDAVHLGLGSDGHTASWPPGDPVVDSERAVEVTGEFNGFRRMTLTPRVVNTARSRLMYVIGADKASMVERWLLRDQSLTVDRVRRSGTVLVTDVDIRF